MNKHRNFQLSFFIVISLPCCFIYFCETLLKRPSSITTVIYFLYYLAFFCFLPSVYQLLFFLFLFKNCYKDTNVYQLARGIFYPRNVETDFLPSTVLRIDIMSILLFCLQYLEQGLIHRLGFIDNCESILNPCFLQN